MTEETEQRLAKLENQQIDLRLAVSALIETTTLMLHQQEVYNRKFEEHDRKFAAIQRKLEESDERFKETNERFNILLEEVRFLIRNLGNPPS